MYLTGFGLIQFTIYFITQNVKVTLSGLTVHFRNPKNLHYLDGGGEGQEGEAEGGVVELVEIVGVVGEALV